MNKFFPFLCTLVFIILLSSPALAVQAHGGAEGLVSHPIGHALFFIRMGCFLFFDILGSFFTMAVAIWCAILSWNWSREKDSDIFRHYILLFTLAIVFFAVSRLFGHLLKQILIFNHMGSTWKQISPFSGAINTTMFVIIFSFGIYFQKFQKIHSKILRSQE